MTRRVLLCTMVVAVMALSMATVLIESNTDATAGMVFESNGIKYTVVDGSEYGVQNAVEVTHSSGQISNVDVSYSGSIVIPAKVTDSSNSIEYDVVGIGVEAFIGAKISSISLPEGLKYINKWAFGASTLTSIEIPSTVIRLGSGTNNSPLFSNGIGSGPNGIVSVTFAQDSKLEQICDNVFAGCVNMTSLEIPNTVTKIGKSVFLGCDNLKNVVIPAGVTDLNMMAQNPYIPNTTNTLSGWSNSSSVVFAEGSPFEKVGGLVYSESKLILSLDDASDIVTIRDGTKSIGDSAFISRTVDTVVIPSTVESIGNYAFKSIQGEAMVFVGGSAPSFGINALQGASITVFAHEGAIGFDKLGITLNRFGVEPISDEETLILGVEKSLPITATYDSPIEMDVASSSDSVLVTLSGGNLTLKAEENVDSTITVSLKIGGMVLDETKFQVSVFESQHTDGNGNTVSVDKNTTTDINTGQDITTTITTVTDKTGTEVSSTLVISTEAESGQVTITTEATIEDDVATITVTADSNTSLSDIVGQASLIQDKIEGYATDPVTEIVINAGDDVEASVTLTLDIVESLNNKVAETGSNSISIIVDHFDEGSMTSAQISALENGNAFELSAVLVDNEGIVVDRIHDLGGSVMAFLPFMISDGMDAEDYGVYYIDIYGNITDMRSSYDSSRGGFVFETDHFSLFAVMEVPVEDPIIPPFYPGWDDDDIPYIPPTVVDDSDSDEPIKVVACAAAAVAAAIMMMFLIVDSRKR